MKETFVGFIFYFLCLCVLLALMPGIPDVPLFIFYLKHIGLIVVGCIIALLIGGICYATGKELLKK